MHFLRFCAFLILVFSVRLEALTVRVDATQGAPRLLVDGQPARARIFWGAPGTSLTPVTPEWKHLEFDFIAAASAENGTMHLRFGAEPGDIFFDEIRVKDIETGSEVIPVCDFERGQASFDRDWTSWPLDASNTVGRISVDRGAGYRGSSGLHINLRNPASGPWPNFHVYHLANLHLVEGHHYHVEMWTRAAPARSISVDFYQPGQPFIHLGGGPDVLAAQVKMAAAAGVDLVSFPIDLPWPKPGEPENWKSVDLACQNVLAANPKALLIPRIPMTPPAWWGEEHSKELMEWDTGTQKDHAVVASPLYRREASARLAALVAHLEKFFGDHVAGYHPAGQNTGEWFYEATWNAPLNGYSTADETAWRLWLKQRYSDDEGLRRAWRDPSASLATAVVPTASSRHAAPAGIFRDPTAEKAILDWGDFQQEAMADCVKEFAHAAREASQGRKLVLFFYGYVFELSGVTNGPATSGHLALRRVLESPDIDVLCAPISYFDRGLGGSAPAMSAPESVALAGKMWLNEDDTHTYLATGEPPGWKDHVTTLADTNEELTRNVAQEAMRNFGTWWMDLTATGWFKDVGMWKRMAELKPLDEALLQSPTPFRPEVAAVIDEASLRRVAAGGQIVTVPGIYETRAAFGRMGAPYGQYLLDDVLAQRVPAKLRVFLDAWSLDASARGKLLQATKGSTSVWCYAPGYFDGDQVSLEAMQQLTGFAFKPATTRAQAVPTAEGHRLGLERGWGVARILRPMLAVADAQPGEILATYPDGSTAVAIRRSGRGVSIFVGVPGLTSELLRLAAREAGVHLFTGTDCNVSANGNFISLHGANDGPIALDTGKATEVTDLLTGKSLGTGPKLTVPLRRGETKVLRN